MLSNPGSDREINLYRQVVLVSWSFLPFCICVFQRVSSTVIGPGEPALVLRSFGRPSLPKTALTSLSKPKTIYTEDVTEPYGQLLRSPRSESCSSAAVQMPQR